MLDFGADAARFRAIADAAAARAGADATRAFAGGDDRRYVLPARFWGQLRMVVAGGVPIHGAGLVVKPGRVCARRA